jgi:hypothetical protein
MIPVRENSEVVIIYPVSAAEHPLPACIFETFAAWKSIPLYLSTWQHAAYRYVVIFTFIPVVPHKAVAEVSE